MAGRYKAYPEYKDSGVEWIGNIPSDWEMWKIKHASPYVASGTTPKSEDEIYYGGEILWVTTGELREDEIFDTQKKVTQKALLDMPTLRLHPAGSVAIAMYGATIGRLGIFGVDATTNQACCVMPPSKIIHNKYLFYWLYATRQEIINLSSGGGQPNVNQEKISSLKISCPDFASQVCVADFLDHETAKIDTLIEKQQQLIQLLKEKRQAVISHAVTKGLNPNAKMRDSGVEWLGEVPAHWQVKGLTKFIGPVVDYRGRTPTKVDDGIFLVTARNIRDGRIDYDASQEFVDPDSARSLLERGSPEIGDLLFTMEAPLGQVALIDRTDIALAQRIVKFRGIPSVMRTRYLRYWLMSSVCKARLETLATGSTALGIKASKLGMIECLGPTLLEQDCIVEYVEREISKNEQLTSKALKVVELLQERRTALISAAVTGKIDVRDWVPPAPDHRSEEAA